MAEPGLVISLALPANPVDQIEQQNGDQGKQQDEQEGIDIP